jgi:hypothetical protein
MTGFPGDDEERAMVEGFPGLESRHVEGDYLTPQERLALRQLVKARRDSHTGSGEHIFSEEQIESLKAVADFWHTFQRVGVMMAAVRSGITLVAFFFAVWLFLRGSLPNLMSILK